MSRCIFSLFFGLTLTVSHGQSYNFRTKVEVVRATMNRAIINADKFIQQVVPTDIFKRHFLLNSYQSRLEDNKSVYLVTFNDSVNFIPNKYEVMYALVFSQGDTLNDQFTIPLDSLGNVSIDTTNYDYTREDLKGLKKLFSGKYKYDYSYVKNFIKTKGLKNAHIQFMNSKSTVYSKDYIPTKYFKHYWYVYDYDKNYSITYVIDPDTGKYLVRKKKFKVVARAKRHVTRVCQYTGWVTDAEPINSIEQL